MDHVFLDKLIARHRGSAARIDITDTTTRILASTHEDRVGGMEQTAGYILGLGSAATIENAASHSAGGEEEPLTTFSTPVQENGSVWGAVVVQAPAPLAASIGSALQTALEAALEYEAHSRQAASGQDEPEQIARMLLAQTPDTEALLSLMNRHELDPSMLRTVICIRLDHHKTSYFNINLSLGYQASFEQLHAEVVRRLRRSRPLNAQDLIYAPDRNTLLILKAFLPGPDLSRLYLALDVVCQDLAAILRSFSAFSFSIAYGNLYPGVDKLYNSWREAEETLAVGRQSGQNTDLYSLDSLLFESVCRHLQPQVVNKMLQPALHKLRRRDGELPMELILCCEAFVDSCMSLSRTAAHTQLHRNTISARLDKLRLLTGLDPAASFRDAFLVKMLAVSLRQRHGASA